MVYDGRVPFQVGQWTHGDLAVQVGPIPVIRWGMDTYLPAQHVRYHVCRLVRPNTVAVMEEGVPSTLVVLVEGHEVLHSFGLDLGHALLGARKSYVHQY